MKSKLRLLKILLRHKVFRRISFIVLDGTEKQTGEKIRVLFSGTPPEKHNIVKRIYSGHVQESRPLTFPGPFFFMILRFNMFFCDLCFYQHRPFVDSNPKSGDFLIPLWIEVEMPLPFNARLKSVKEDLRRIRKFRLSYRVTQDRGEIIRFLETMWEPMLQHRFQEEEIIREQINFENKRYELLLVKDNHEEISGVVIRYDTVMPRLWHNGLKDGDVTLWKKGAIAATYYFAAQYLYSKGYERMSLGFSRTFLTDGLLQYKKKWEITLQEFRKYAYLMRIYRKSVPVRGFLLHNPCIVLLDKGMAGLVFHDRHESSTDGMSSAHALEFSGLPLIDCDIDRIA